MPPRSSDLRLGVQFRILTDAQIQDIHLASLEILSRIGVAVEHDAARQLLKKHGCALDGHRVRIPAALVKQALACAPDRILLFDRNDRPAVDLAADRSYFGTGSDTPTYVDPYSGEIKPTSRETVRMFARFCDALPNINFVMSMGIAKERPNDSSFVHQYAAMQEGTTKPIVFTAQGAKDIEPIYRIALAAAGDEPDLLRLHPRCLLYTEPISPLILTRESMEMLLFCAEKRLPVTYPTGIMCGGTAPVTLAAGLALGNAETLAALTVLQLAAPGSPYLYGGNVSVMDMHTSIYTYASPEFHAAFAAFADLGRHYRLPVWGLAGASDSKTLDAQAAAEAAAELLLARLSGNNLIHDVGYLNSGLTASLEMLVLADEIIEWVNRVARGIEVNERTLALDVIEKVGPGGHFLECDHTLQNFRNAIWQPRVFNRDPFAVWQAAGSKPLFARLNERAKQILETHESKPLPAKVQKKVAKILAEREKAGS